jgi:hypothetical protein
MEIIKPLRKKKIAQAVLPSHCGLLNLAVVNIC